MTEISKLRSNPVNSKSKGLDMLFWISVVRIIGERHNNIQTCKTQNDFFLLFLSNINLKCFSLTFNILLE